MHYIEVIFKLMITHKHRIPKHRYTCACARFARVISQYSSAEKPARFTSKSLRLLASGAIVDSIHQCALRCLSFTLLKEVTFVLFIAILSVKSYNRWQEGASNVR